MVDDGLRSYDLSIVPRNQILLRNARGQTARQIGISLGGAGRRCVMWCRHLTPARQLALIHARVVPTRSDAPSMPLVAGCEQLRDLLQHSPRDLGQSISNVTMALFAGASARSGHAATPSITICHETIH